MISGATLSEPPLPTLQKRLWARRRAVALLLAGTIALGAGLATLIAKGPGLPRLALPTFGLVIAACSAWQLTVAVLVIPRRTIVWFRYDQRTLEYRRARDSGVSTLRPLDILRIDTATDSRGEIVRYHVRLVGGTRLVIDRGVVGNGDALAEQLAADIAHSPRWMFS